MKVDVQSFVLIVLFLVLVIAALKSKREAHKALSKWWMLFLHEIEEDKMKALVFDLDEKTRLKFVSTLCKCCFSLYAKEGFDEAVKKFSDYCSSVKDARELLAKTDIEDRELVDYMLSIFKK